MVVVTVLEEVVVLLIVVKVEIVVSTEVTEFGVVVTVAAITLEPEDKCTNVTVIIKLAPIEEVTTKIIID